MKLIVLVALVGYAVAQQSDCEAEKAKVKTCLGSISIADFKKQKDEIRAAKDKCFVDICPGNDARDKDRKKCMKDALESTGLRGSLESCVSGANIENAELFVALSLGKGRGKGKGGKGNGGPPGGRSNGGGKGYGGRGQGAGGAAAANRPEGGKSKGKGARLLAACNNDEAKVEQLRKCLDEAKPKREADDANPKQCVKDFPIDCRQSVCTCFKPALDAKKAELLRAVDECREGDDDDEDEKRKGDAAERLFKKICEGKGNGKGSERRDARVEERQQDRRNERVEARRDGRREERENTRGRRQADGQQPAGGKGGKGKGGKGQNGGSEGQGGKAQGGKRQGQGKRQNGNGSVGKGGKGNGSTTAAPTGGN